MGERAISLWLVFGITMSLSLEVSVDLIWPYVLLTLVTAGLAATFWGTLKQPPEEGDRATANREPLR